MQPSPAYTYDKEAKKITVRGTQTFPREVFDFAQNEPVEIVDMSDNRFTELPHDLHRLKDMRIAFFSKNPLQSIPKALADCESLDMVGFKSCGIKTFGEHTLPPGLKGLILTDNEITELPHLLAS